METLKLHEAIKLVLKEAERALTTIEIANAINGKKLYLRKDTNPVSTSQIGARVSNYPRLFQVDRSCYPHKISLL